MVDILSKYDVRSDGVIYSKYSNKPLKPYQDKGGYLRVDLYIDKTKYSWLLHRLVASYHVEGFEEGLVVNHIDYDKTNNKANNLEWVTSKVNYEHSRHRILPASIKASIKINSKDWGVKQPNGDIVFIRNMNQFCKENNLNNSHMSAVALGKRSHHKGFKCWFSPVEDE